MHLRQIPSSILHRMSEDQSCQDLGPEMFCNGERTVINWAGANYYKACGAEMVKLPSGETSTCTKPIGHPGLWHEDFHGNQTRTDAR